MHFVLYLWTLAAATASPLSVHSAKNTKPAAMKAADTVLESPMLTDAPAQPAPQPVNAAGQAAIAGATARSSVQNHGRELNLSPEQEKKLRELMARQKMTDAQRRKEAQMLDRTPVLNKTYNPNITEDKSIPKRF
jgi:hypothetical protein